MRSMRLSLLLLPCVLVVAGCSGAADGSIDSDSITDQAEVNSSQNVDTVVKDAYAQVAAHYRHGNDTMLSILDTRITNVGPAGEVNPNTEIEVSGAAFLPDNKFASFSAKGTVGAGLQMGPLEPVGGGAWLAQAHFAPTALPKTSFAEALKVLKADGEKVTKVFEVTLTTPTSDTDLRAWFITYERSSMFGMRQKRVTKSVEEETNTIEDRPNPQE